MASKSRLLRSAICLAGAGLLGALASCSPATSPGNLHLAAAPDAASKPNILFILVDDMGYGDLSLTGNQLIATPHIDALARDGMVMTQFYDAAPICSPSRAGFMTGRFPAENRFVTFISDRKRNRNFGQADWLDTQLPNMARTLHQVGYATAHVGKWHLGGGRDVADAPLPTEYGFDESYTQFEGLGPRVLPSDIANNLAKQSAALGQGPIEWLPRAQTSGRYVDKLLDFVRREKDGPWFAQLWFDDVHTPWQPSAEQMAAVRGKGRDEREDRFLAVLAAMDVEVGRLVEGLRESGELDDTLIVFTSDNGPTIGADMPGSAGPYRGRKASLYEGGIRQPLIVRWPGQVPAGSRDGQSVVQAVDLYPTLAAIAGAPVPADADGIDMTAAWRGQPIAERPDLYTHIARPAAESALGPHYSIRSGPWKLLMDADGTDAELYNLDDDPGERRDRLADSPDVARRLTAQLSGWIDQLPEPGPAVGRRR